MIEEIRANEAKKLSAWFRGEGKHPHGKSGENWLVPYQLSQRIHPMDYDAMSLFPDCHVRYRGGLALL